MGCDKSDALNVIISGKWEAAIDNDSIPLFLVEMGIRAKFGSGQQFVIAPNERGGFQVVPIRGFTGATYDLKQDIVEMDEERRTIPAPRALLAALSDLGSKEVVLVGMLDIIEIYPRAVWDRVERAEMQDLKEP